ncbi:competence protein CoiA-like family protein [Pseudogulbenkiania sp. NH8B]|uniref:competence protein CoiA n=1 Tax=Pseudogulbenkiania sp. (strain NH8B) TaxID=748280 RepID=UPI0002279B57|nr:competence protein CoiA family protein [Pseudogulbenkiania sp. NH8B]BAK76492.1 competence protein CoiA-like family protein [Pseudogulbenkiania sp. NH8B]BAK76921.1 competence protein CoiA-like family protein [Pseudogulbenkiania sp. NH8B]
MLTAIRQSDESKVIASVAQKIEAPFFCPTCKKQVVLNKGNIKTHHFKHKPPITCHRGKGETEAHMRCKLDVFHALANSANITGLELEKDFGVSVADVFACINSIPVAIEIQRSNLSVSDITTRTENYHRLGVAVIWIGLRNENLSSNMYSPKAWEKWCHATYFGRVYYWVEGLILQPIHFGDYKLYVEQRTWYEPGGSENTSGGYYKTSKRYKTPSPGVLVNLATDFRWEVKKAFSSKTIRIPQCTIYVDNQKAWWK